MEAVEIVVLIGLAVLMINQVVVMDTIRQILKIIRITQEMNE